MPKVLELPPEIRDLVSSGVLRPVSDGSFAIDALSHRARIGGGWDTLIYTLELEEGDHGETIFAIREETTDIGDEILLSTEDADEAAYWITQQIAEKDE